MEDLNEVQQVTLKNPRLKIKRSPKEEIKSKNIPWKRKQPLLILTGPKIFDSPRIAGDFNVDLAREVQW